MPTVLAAADIGSNTVHLLVANIGLTGLQRLSNDSEWLSLGQVVSHTGEIPKEIVGRLVSTLTEFKAKAKSLDAGGLYVFATEAVRKAKNHKEVLRFVRKETGLEVDVITPRREAELGLKGALLDCPKQGKFLFAETGGGSVQVAICDGLEILEETSMPIGTGVLIDQAEGATKSVEAMKETIEKAISEIPNNESVAQILASGGVARGLWRALHPDGDPIIHQEELEFLRWSTSRLNQKTISNRYRVKGKRAVTLLPGSLIYLALMRKFQTSELTVSQFGVREGAILELSQGKIVPCAL